MGQKTTIGHIIRRGTILLCAVLCFVGLLACSDTESSTAEIIDVYAANVTVDYDGRAHTITLVNTLPTDTVTYWTDNTSFSNKPPAFTEVGEYTVHFKVTRKGCADFYSSATVTILPIVLSGISAVNSSYVYDGVPHYIQIYGISDDDTVTFSLDGLYFSRLSPPLTDVGEYTVYYRVERSYGYFASSCSITIYPNVFGRYFNPSYGVVMLSEDNVEFDGFDGAGYIGSERFSVTNNVLSFMGLSFTLLSEFDYVYRLIVAQEKTYFVAQADGTLDISFSDNTAVIRLDGDVIASVPNCNYSESGEIVSYEKLRFKQAFTALSDITDVTVILSERDVNPMTFDDVYAVYDGQPHGFGLSDSVIFPDGKTEFTQVGRHTVTAIFLSAQYLPKVLDISLVILPYIDGVYIHSAHVIQIADGYLSVDGKERRELTVKNDDWACDGLPITVTDDEITYDGVEYAKTEDKVFIVRVGDAQYLATINGKIDQIYASYDGTELKFTTDGKLLLRITLCGENINVYLGNKLLATLSHENRFFTIGKADFDTDVLIVELIIS